MAVERKMFGREKLQEVFTSLGAKLRRPITVYLLGGGAMCFRLQKIGTKDLDLVFTNRKDHDVFAQALKVSGFIESVKLEKAYEDMKASSIWMDEGDFRFDLFTNSVCGALSLSEKMISRSSLLEVYGSLTVLLVSNEDVVLFKGITERDKDTNDMAEIISPGGMNWKIILQECKDQSKSNFYYGLLYNKFMDLEEKHNISVPIADQLLELDQKLIVRLAYEALLKKGLTPAQAKAHLMEKEFTASEIDGAVNSN